MPRNTVRVGLVGAVLASALILTPTVPAHALSSLPPIGGSSGVVENRGQGLVLQNREATGEIVTYAVATQPQHGTAVVIGPTASTILYTPDHDYVGDDSFTYTETDGVTTSAPGLMELSVVPSGDSAPQDPVLPLPRVVAVPPGGVDGDASSRLTISGEDFIDSQPDGQTHVLPVGADVIEGYNLNGVYIFEDVSRNAYDPVQMYAEFLGLTSPRGAIPLGTHPLVPYADSSAGTFELLFSAFHSGCSRQPGTEDIQRFDVAPNGDPVAVDLTFAITCDADTVHVMTGTLHWRASTGSPSASAPEPSSTPVPTVSGGASAPTPDPSAPVAGAGGSGAMSTPVPSPSASGGSGGAATSSPSSSPAPAPVPTEASAPVATTAPSPAPTSHAASKQRSRTMLPAVTRSHGRVRFVIETERAAAGSSTWDRWASATVRIEERTSQGWRVVRTVRTGPRGTVSVSLRASEHRWRVIATGSASVTGSTSATRTG